MTERIDASGDALAKGIASRLLLGHGSHMTTPPARRTLRDQLLDAEQARAEVTIETATGNHRGFIKEVGVDYATLKTEQGETDCALFHIVSVDYGFSS